MAGIKFNFQHLIVLVFILLSSICFYPAARLIFDKWSASEDYSHAFFVIPIIGFMIWEKRNIFYVEQKGWFGSVCVALSLLLYLSALQLQIPTVIFLATAFYCVSVLYYLGGAVVFTRLLVAIILLFMVIPIPNQLFSLLTGTLQLKISQTSEIIIRMFSIPVYRDGNVLNIPSNTFQVVDACSGVRSLISMTTLSLILAHFTLIKMWSKASLLLFSIPVAIIVNLVRVVSMVIVYHFWSIDLLQGAAHTITGLILFGLGLAILFSFQRVLEKCEVSR